MHAPVLIAIDDAQWLDAASADALAFALRRLDGVRLGLLATWRAADSRLPLRLDEVMPSTRWHRLTLGPLHPDDLGELLDQRFPRPPRRSSRSRVIAVAAGNPLYAIELMAAHLMSETPVDDSLELPPRLEELLAGRLERLPRQAAEPLAAAASLAAPTVALGWRPLARTRRRGWRTRWMKAYCRYLRAGYRQVADELFLSVKTVATHLTSVYGKLGIRSRAELARHLRDSEPHPGDR